MSFSIAVKEEVAAINLNEIEKKYFLSSFIKINGTLKISGNEKKLHIRSENAKVAKLVFLSLKKVYNIDVKFYVYKKTTLNKNNVYVIQIKEKLDTIIKNSEVPMINKKTFFSEENKEKIRAYLLGSFLASGSVNSPRSKNYHLEISSHDSDQSEFIKTCLEHYSFSPKIIKRRNNYIVYLKKSEEIADVLKLFQANNNLMKFEDERITKDYFNFHNRLNICEVFNVVKTMETANRQIKRIELIKSKNKEYLLDEKDKIVANIRIGNLESSLQELVEHYIETTGESISKSGINHRLRKIEEIAKKLEENDIEQK